MIRNLIQLLRPSHSLKNALVFAPLFFAGGITHPVKLGHILIAFIAFCLCASAVYIFNDYCDMQSDRKHPTNKDRPLANGSIRPLPALICMVLLLMIGFNILYRVSFQASLILLAYCLLNLFYCLYGKHVLGLDVTLIACGFILRLAVGAYTVDTPLSHWIISLTFSTAIFLALAKRHHELILFQHMGVSVRNNMTLYRQAYLAVLVLLSASITFILYAFYSHYAPKAPSYYLYLSNIWVAAGLGHYVKLTLIDHNSGSPTDLILSDRPLQTLLILWLINLGWVLYVT